MSIVHCQLFSGVSPLSNHTHPEHAVNRGQRLCQSGRCSRVHIQHGAGIFTAASVKHIRDVDAAGRHRRSKTADGVGDVFMKNGDPARLGAYTHIAVGIIHRIDDEEDIKILKSSLLIPDDRVSIPSLRQGEALIRSEGMIRPCKVKFAISDVKEAYSLAESFKNNSEGNEDIAIKFAATSVLNDEEVREEIQDMILVLLLFFKKNGFDRWYDAIHFFLAKIIIILQEQGRYEIVNGRLQVIFEIISETIKGMQLGLNVKQRGNIHMFLMRFLELYYYQKCDYKVKPAETNLMQMFYVNHIQKFVDEIPCDEEVEDSEE